jgi:hypothetical protein
VLGLAIGEKSVFIAELWAGGERPEVKRLGEFIYPPDASLTDPPALGQRLGEFLRAQKFSTRHTVIGLPAKWLLVKTKEVPPADSSVAADLLRLQAEGDFSSELKDLVFDYTGEASASGARNVLLIATPQRHIDLAKQLCEAANLDPIAVTSSAAALGAVTGRAGVEDAVVLTLTAAGSELTAQSGGHTSTLRHLRAPTPEPLFLSELRRAVSLLPANGTSGGREIIVWDGSETPTTLSGETLGMRIRNGDLPSLGVSASEAARNGGGRKYAAAVALGLSVLGERSLPIDFLHSRLAAPKKQILAAWMIWSIVGAMALIAAVVFGYRDLQKGQAQLDDLIAKRNGMKDDLAVARAFVAKVSFAQRWHGGDPRYLACLREITQLVPEDGQTYATSVDIREKEPPRPDPSKSKIASKANDPRNLQVVFQGKAPSQGAASLLVDRFQAKKDRFADVQMKGTQIVGKAGEVTFSFSCTYMPAEKLPH